MDINLILQKLIKYDKWHLQDSGNGCNVSSLPQTDTSTLFQADHYSRVEGLVHQPVTCPFGLPKHQNGVLANPFELDVEPSPKCYPTSIMLGMKHDFIIEYDIRIINTQTYPSYICCLIYGSVLVRTLNSKYYECNDNKLNSSFFFNKSFSKI